MRKRGIINTGNAARTQHQSSKREKNKNKKYSPNHLPHLPLLSPSTTIHLTIRVLHERIPYLLTTPTFEHDAHAPNVPVIHSKHIRTDRDRLKSSVQNRPLLRTAVANRNRAPGNRVQRSGITEEIPTFGDQIGRGAKGAESDEMGEQALQSAGRSLVLRQVDLRVGRVEAGEEAVAFDDLVVHQLVPVHSVGGPAFGGHSLAVLGFLLNFDLVEGVVEVVERCWCLEVGAEKCLCGAFGLTLLDGELERVLGLDERVCVRVSWCWP